MSATKEFYGERFEEEVERASKQELEPELCLECQKKTQVECGYCEDCYEMLTERAESALSGRA